MEKVAEALPGFPGLTHEALLKLDGYGRQPLEPSYLNTGHHASAVTMAAEGIRRREVVAEGGPLKPTHPIQCASPPVRSIFVFRCGHAVPKPPV